MLVPLRPCSAWPQHRPAAARCAARALRRPRRARPARRGQWQFVLVLACCAGLVTLTLWALTDDPARSLHQWHRWWRKHRSCITRDRIVLLSLGLLTLLSAPKRRKTRVLRPAAKPQKPRPQVTRPPTRQSALDRLRQAIREGEALRAAILVETFENEPLRRAELQILMEEAARNTPELLPSLAEQLEQRGVALDWSLSNDCRGNFGRYALDAALEVLVKETRNEQAALSLLSIGQGSGSHDTSQLDADPLMRAAAAQGMTQLVQRLIRDFGADVNSKDPRYGSSALDRAVDAGKEQTALALLDLGADPLAGRGVGYLMARGGPQVRARLPEQQAPAPLPASEEDVEKFRSALARSSERLLLQQLQRLRLSKVQLAQLLQEVSRLNFRPRLLRKLCDDLAATLRWDEAPLDIAFARRPLDAALETAVQENPDPRTATWLLDEGMQQSKGRWRLNANPLLRTAASRCQVQLLDQLVEMKADPNAPDPRYGSTALDRAVSAGCSSAALVLLALGADPDAGHGRRSLLERASPEVAAKIRGG